MASSSAGGGTSVTLVLYQVGDKWWEEPALNLVAALAQWSSYTHVEIAIGEDPGARGMMSNVARVFNDAVGVELTERTGKNPAYTYLSIGCSKAAEQRMLAFARAQVGKKFSNAGMARSLVWPRQTDGSTWFCAELVAAILQKGGLMAQDSNPGAATPHSLYKLYSKQAAATANPYTLRSMNLSLGGVPMNSTASSSRTRPGRVEQVPLLNDSRCNDPTPTLQPVRSGVTSLSAPRARTDSPPRASFKVVNARGSGLSAPLPLGTGAPGLNISLASLNTNHGGRKK